MKFKKIVNEGGIASERSRMHSKDAEKGWFGIKDAKFIYHGDWNDPGVEYKGVLLNYWDIESGLLEVYRDEHPEDKNDKGFDKWMAAHPEEIRSELELLYDAEMEYRANNPEEQYDESWIGDKAKAGWNKVKAGAKAVKAGAKKMAKAVGDAFKGPFRKGDHIVMKGEDGETYKGTIKSFDLGDKTYEVLLGNPVNEDLQETEVKKDLSEQVDEYIKSLSQDQIQTLTLRCSELLDYWNEPLGSDTILRVRETMDNDERFLKFLCKTVPLGNAVNEETYDDRVDREYKSAVGKYKSERKRVKDKIRDIVGDEDADDVFAYWDSIQSSFNMSWRHGGFYGDYRKHLDKLADILGPEGRDIIADIQRKFDQQAKELSEYYDTHDYTGD